MVTIDLSGRHALVMGVANHRSLSWAIAQKLHEAGATLCLTYQGERLKPTVEELQKDLDVWLAGYNEQRPHQGRWCFGKTPMRTFLDTAPLAREKMLAAG